MGGARRLITWLWGSKSRKAFLMLVMRVRSAGKHASAFRHHASDVLELNRGVADRKAVAEHRVELLQNAVARRGRHVFDQRVAAQRVSAGAETPYVQIVHVQ